jgi:hypothetical protein
MTREELFSQFLQRADPSYRTFVDYQRSAVRRGRGPVVRDVCRQCNNVRLGTLDHYGASLYRSSFRHPVRIQTEVAFAYDYNKLLRWLLKLAYNDERSHCEPYKIKPFAPFILSDEPKPPMPISLWVGIVVPSPTTPEQQQKGLPKFLYPERHTLAELFLKPPIQEHVVFARLVAFNAYVFEITAWRSDTSESLRVQWSAMMCRRNRLSELRNDRSEVLIIPGFTDFLTFQKIGVGNSRRPFER